MFAELSKAFIFQKFAVKFYFGLSLHIFQHGSSLSLENVCDSWCMHQTGFSSAAVVPQSKFTELCSSAAVVPQSKSTEMWSSAAPFHHDLWYFRHRTNEHFRSMLFVRKSLWTAHSSYSQVTEINTLDQITAHIETNHTISLAFKTFS